WLFRVVAVCAAHLCSSRICGACPLRSALLPYATLFRSALAGPRRMPFTPFCSCSFAASKGRGPKGRTSPTRACLPSGDTYNTVRSEEHTSELQSHLNLVCRLLLEKKK